MGRMVPSPLEVHRLKMLWLLRLWYNACLYNLEVFPEASEPINEETFRTPTNIST
jgi:hypothetical protein